ncbi:fimbrillin family protein [Leyella stercorea]|uniref:fimbrillin family protein n=1 Tax=Leyella stercorea TaxID=363265 RepID=UPI0024316136|nr:fimbrillin family protein [Leyella stercorea]
MNKHIFLMGMAAAMFMTSCTNEDDLAGGSNNQRLNSDVPIVLSAGQQANKTRAALGNVVDGKYDGTFDTPDGTNLGFFCLATGNIAGKQTITWQEGFDNPNFLWLKNIQAKAVTSEDADLGKRVTNLTLFDENGGTTQTNHYYPMGSQYSYTFYGYYPYSANVAHNGNKYSVKVTGLDGTTDLIWGKSFVKPDDPDKADAYSAKYLRDKKKRVVEGGGTWDDKAHKENRPQLTFVHKLMKFNIILQKGSGENARVAKLGIKSAKLLNVADAGELTIADLDNRLDALTDDVKGKEGEFVVDWTTAKNHNTEDNAFVLKDKDGNTIGNPANGPYLGENVKVTVGDGFLIPVPTLIGTNDDGSKKYEDNGYLGTDAAELANKGIFRLRVEYYLSDAPDKVYKAAQYEITPKFKEAADEAWQAGYEYDIVISVSDPELIQTYGNLTPWEKRTIELE